MYIALYVCLMLVAISTDISGEKQGSTFTDTNLSPVLLPLSPPTSIMIKSQNHLLFLHAANEKTVTGTDATEATNGAGWKWSRNFGPRDIVNVKEAMAGGV